MTKILAVINSWPNAERILAKATEIARPVKAEVFVYCPITSRIEEMNRYIGFDNYETVREELLYECQSRLDGLAGMDKLDSLVEWQSKPYRAVAAKAEELSAAMVVMGVSEHSVLGDFIHKPDDWHLLRDATCPVLIMGEQEQDYTAVTVAVDVMEDSDEHQSLNARILDEAKLMAEALHLPLKVITVIPEPSYIYSDISATNTLVMENFRSQAQAMAKERQGELLSRLGIRAHSSDVVAGPVETQLQHAQDDSGLLVIGTIANKGLKGFFLGNTAERLLQHLRGDMLVVN
ncbi:MAG: universal stress protein [Porticoccaceae bacterium]|nr:universal stress protein [Porticoccaceae bacterium]